MMLTAKKRVSGSSLKRMCTYTDEEEKSEKPSQIYMTGEDTYLDEPVGEDTAHLPGEVLLVVHVLGVGLALFL